ncbi:MAG: lactate racemase domain-containing protein, partial [Acidobacteriota bacterium]|nr:lactate racemase domain-containing protein [Acidobacteriota bacterium]
MAFPKVVRVKQRFHSTRVDDIPARVAREVGRLDLSERLNPGDSVAVTAGSRGVANIAAVTRSLAEELKKRGARPFIVPAMGSHGGGTAEGQRGVLERYGITEATMGVPVRATMETLPIGETRDGIPVVLDRNALEADHIAVVNRIKPHTDFDAEIESGLTKMLAIGLGKHQGAIRYHRANKRYGYYRVLTGVAEVV